MRLGGALRLSLIVVPLIRFRAWDRVRVLVRAHSQADWRFGLPKSDRKSLPATIPSGSSADRIPGGAPANFGRLPVATVTASSICSALRRRGVACEKLIASSSFHLFL